MIELRAAMRTYFLVNGVYSLGRALPQAILTPILVGKGLSFGEIALVQMAFAAAQILWEIPSGVISDVLSRRFSYLLSIGLIAVSYGIVLVGTGLPLMLLAWTLYGLSAAMLSASMDYHFVLALRDDEAALRRFYGLDRNIVLAMSALAAVFSGPVYSMLGERIYAVSIGLFAVSYLYGLLRLPQSRTEGRQGSSGLRIFAELAAELRTAAGDARLILLICVLASTEFAITPFFQFWQMAFTDAHVALWMFGSYFIASQLLNIVANFVVGRIGGMAVTKWCALICVGGVAVLLLMLSGSPWILLPMFVLPLPLFVFIAEVEIELQTVLPAGAISSVRSLSGAVESLAALAVLGVSAALLAVLPSAVLIGSWILLFVALSTAGIILIERGRSTSRERDMSLN